MTRRRLDLELVRRGLVDSRSRATDAIAAGQVLVDGAPADRAARRVSPAERISLRGEPARFVSRGGEKLDAALTTFSIVVEGRHALDVGASTGGFTDCLLQRGAAHVHAVDVGRGQLAWSLRNDPRVTVLERTNARHLDADTIGGLVPIAVADASFISLLTLASALARVTTPDADLVLLAKPQFEVGRGHVPRGGVVRDPVLHADVLTRLAVGLGEHALPVVAATASPLRGADGNREFLLWVRRGQPAADPAAVAAVAAEETAA
ncbi:MAG TPA: TlyA family RNA methyltransferase [Acidimicrobiia bacterium]|nr:TlyA family RNA methyltransferase [Acidimicrobiia bacterium]